MKDRVFILALIVATLPAPSSAYPALGGGRGLFRVQNALVEPDAGLTVSLHALARDADFYMYTPGPNRTGRVVDIIVPELSYAPIVTKYAALELFGSWGGAFQNPRSYREPGFVWGFHDLKAGGKFSIPILPVLKLGGTASYTLRPRDLRTDWQILDSSALPPATRLAWGGLVTLHFQDLTLPAPNLIINVGKHVNNLTRNNETYYGAAVEYQGAGFALFAEGVAQQPDVTPAGSKNRAVLDTKYGHIHLTPGIAIGSATSWFLKVGYTFSIGGDSLDTEQPDEIAVGLGYATPFGRQSRPEYGQIAGTVSDANTGAPLSATVSFPDHPRLAALTTDARTGGFKIVKVPAGPVTVRASAEGYETRLAPLMVKDRSLATATLKLPPALTPVDITGRVSDRKTGEALAATVLVPEADSAVLRTDPATGVYNTRLKPGAYSMVVESGDYLKQLASLLVESGKPMVKDFQMVREGMAITLKGIYFDFDKATIKPESRPALDDAAKILKDNPTITVEIHGHTDSRGSNEYNLKLSKARATSVVDYLVRDSGIEAARLTARGFGESKPIATNNTDAGRALNRRVEFAILGQTIGQTERE